MRWPMAASFSSAGTAKGGVPQKMRVRHRDIELLGHCVIEKAERDNFKIPTQFLSNSITP